MTEVKAIGAMKVTQNTETGWKCSPSPARTPTLAERARKLAKELNDRMVAESRKQIETIVLQYPTRYQYVFDMKKHIGAAMGQSCTEQAYKDLGEWLKAEGFAVDTQQNKTAEAIKSISFNQRNDTRSAFSEFTYYISW